MRLAEAASPPTGYLDFCQRQPEDCGGAPPAVIRKVAEIELSRRNAAEARHILAGGRPTTTGSVQSRNVNWGSTFAEARRRREMAEQSNAAMDEAMSAALAPKPAFPAILSLAAAPGGDELNLQRLVHVTGPAAPALAKATPAVQPPEAARPALTPALWSTLTRVNDKVNRDILRRSDIQVYGVIDHWATPLAAGDNQGDCEDYVLEKRRALIAAGLPASALSIAVANTSWGESHAVLLVATDQGDYVLDSLTPWILPWRKASLTWRERQVDGAPFRWAMVNASVIADALVSPSTPAAAVPPAAAEAKALEAAPPPRLPRTEAFTGRPNGVASPAQALVELGDEPRSPITLAQFGAGGPLRGRLH